MEDKNLPLSELIGEADKQESDSIREAYDRMFEDSITWTSSKNDHSEQEKDSIGCEVGKDESKAQNDQAEDEETHNGRKSQSQLLVNLAIEFASFFHTPDDEAFATIRVP